MSDDRLDPEMEQRLREHGARWRAAQAPPPEPRWTSGGTTRRRRLLGSLIAAAVAVAVVGGTLYFADRSGRPPTAHATPTPGPTETGPGGPTRQTSEPPTSSPAPIAGIREIRANVPRSRPAGDVYRLDEVEQADAAFALALYEQLATVEDGNLFFSPYSLATALSMTYAGARGQTATQLGGALGVVGDDQATWHEARNVLDLRLMRPRTVPTFLECEDTDRTQCEGQLDPLTLEPTNAFFGQDGYPFEDPFLRTLAANYGAAIYTANFEVDPEAARTAINAWVEDRTRGRIPELLKQGVVDRLTAAVLVNAIYFHANWAYQFDPDKTRELPFSGLSDPVSMMHRSIRSDYYVNGDGWKSLRLPYVGGASMVVLVPDAGLFWDIERRLSDVYPLATGLGTDTIVDLGLPKWETESDLSAVPALKSLGVVDLFDRDLANLTGVTTAERLYVKDVVHAANITVDEFGTEAAAATAVVMERGSLPPRATLTIDRPFIYMITDDETGEILFIGRVLDPNAGR